MGIVEATDAPVVKRRSWLLVKLRAALSDICWPRAVRFFEVLWLWWLIAFVKAKRWCSFVDPKKVSSSSSSLPVLRSRFRFWVNLISLSNFKPLDTVFDSFLKRKTAAYVNTQVIVNESKYTTSGVSVHRSSVRLTSRLSDTE